ncbi:MAG: hypothetical protein HY288_18420 [Planctomycetia bacterium]|nr:hypothetical protein [Planctomycetia bacterium]
MHRYPHLFPHLLLLFCFSAAVHAQTIGNHPARYDSNGILLAWTSWTDALAREMQWYAKCPIEHGYPRFVFMTFMDGNYEPIARNPSLIPATQNGMGIISYLKWYRYKDKRPSQVLAFARSMGDYLVNESLTPDVGKYPRFSRSTGWRSKFPQPPDCGSQNDLPYEIEPDKGGIAGYALVVLYEETKDEKYLRQAVHNARVLARNMIPGDGAHSPWPFRADYRTGVARGDVSGNMSFILRLFDKLIARGEQEFKPPREKLWRWIKDYQMPNLAKDKDGLLWVLFFEDHSEPDNRTAWAPLNLARYLLEDQEKLDPNWQADAQALIEFVNRRFITVRLGVPVCGEQEHDRDPWGGILSTYGAVLAMYCAATGDQQYKGMAYQALNFALYATDDDGCPTDSSLGKDRGGWQEDAHTDKVHNYLDAMTAFPEWAK